jgi:hypothetical protein
MNEQLEIPEGLVETWNGEEWVHFPWAVDIMLQSLSVIGPAEAQLRRLCANGEIRAILFEDVDEPEQPQAIPPNRWRDEAVDHTRNCFVGVSRTDFEHWLSKRPTQPSAGGKQSRLVRLLAEMFPAGVPNRADCPREPLRAELLKCDPSLKPLDLKTLKTAIETCNRVLGNARNASVSD